MIKSKICLTLGIASLFLSTSFAGSYIKIEGIAGESKDKQHKGWSDVISVSGLEGPKGAATGLPTGKRQHKPITVTKAVDKSSPLFQANGTSGQNPIAKSSMTIEQDGVTYLLDGIKVLDSKESGKTETLTISYASIKILPQAALQKSLKMSKAKKSDHNASRSNTTSSD